MRFASKSTSTRTRRWGRCRSTVHVCPSRWAVPCSLTRRKNTRRPRGTGLQVQLPLVGKRSPWWGGLEAQDRPLPDRRHVAIRTLPQGRTGGMMETGPHLGLPSSIVAFDRPLEPGLAGRREHRDDPHTQTQARDTADGIRALMRALEPGVVVELGIAWQPELPPVRDQGLNHGARPDRWTGPRRDQPAVQREAVEHFDAGPAFDHQTLDDVEAVQLRTVRGHLRLISASGRWAPTDPPATVQCPMPVQDTSDRPHRRDAAILVGAHLAVDGSGPVLLQVARVTQRSTQRQHDIFCGRFRAMNLVRDVRPQTNRLDPAAGRSRTQRG